MTELCKVCDERRATVHGRCNRCECYFLRNGKEREKGQLKGANHYDFIFYKPYPGVEWKTWFQGA